MGLAMYAAVLRHCDRDRGSYGPLECLPGEAPADAWLRMRFPPADMDLERADAMLAAIEGHGSRDAALGAVDVVAELLRYICPSQSERRESVISGLEWAVLQAGGKSEPRVEGRTIKEG